ncbi:unnamed protein product [Heterosigma akashiwo]
MLILTTNVMHYCKQTAAMLHYKTHKPLLSYIISICLSIYLSIYLSAFLPMVFLDFFNLLSSGALVRNLLHIDFCHELGVNLVFIASSERCLRNSLSWRGFVEFSFFLVDVCNSREFAPA